MVRRISILAVGAMCLLLSASVHAGGPPWLCVPIDGVTTENAGDCAKLLASKLGEKVFSQNEGPFRGVQIRQGKKQSYVTFYIAEDVSLRDIEEALKGSRYSIPRDRLRLFGHVVLEIDTAAASDKDFLANLDALNQVSIVGSENRNGYSLVTIDLPYPVGDRESVRQTMGWEKFQRNDLNEADSTSAKTSITANGLPKFAAIRDVLAQHKASLRDIRWSTNYACRAVGCVTAPDAAAATASTQPTNSSRQE